MDITIKTIEDLSLNAWPSHQIQVYDGWLLRFSYFYTHRTNSVEQIGASLLPLSKKSPTARRSTGNGAPPQSSRSRRCWIRRLTGCSQSADISQNTRRRS